MAGNTKAIVKDVDSKPAPQYFNPTLDQYEYLYGRNGANRVELYGPDGTPISTTSGKLNIRASEIETLLAGGLPAALSAGGGLKVGVIDALPVGSNIIGQVKLTDGTDALLVNTNGSINIVPYNSAGTELFTAANPGNVQLTGSFATMRTPVTGVKTVTATAAEIFAGASRLVGRRKMILKNEDPILRFRIGPSSVTQQNGFPVEPSAVLELDFDPAVDVPIYAISEGASLLVAVMEV
jgi:hypothetical protein